MTTYSNFPHRYEMISEFETAMSDYRCQFHCLEKYKPILMEIFWHDFSEKFYPKEWLLSFRDELQDEFHWPWLEECRARFREDGIVPTLWEDNGLSLAGKIPVQFQLKALSRTITSVSYGRKKYSDLVKFLTDLDWRDIFIPSGPTASILDSKIAEEKNPTLKHDILTKGYLSAPPYYPYDTCHISLKRNKKISS
jgi:hypothetical protein